MRYCYFVESPYDRVLIFIDRTMRIGGPTGKQSTSKQVFSFQLARYFRQLDDNLLLVFRSYQGTDCCFFLIIHFICIFLLIISDISLLGMRSQFHLYTADITTAKT